ncbi:winged helix-turn-helix transcriptional regulator [Metallosphaera tengchongensis]|uniref:Winged helix-turn-helix transcriptional regulator n=1 Tax=Metallosphaera tengchongensis TaxID=1532350 RepID=A0A6N0NQK9_9CREN|nr:metalloregulator ArsR/SmtB family transcription factor [Metallosphaera tengchongensis]QKQ99005.1 winged helix-turn-helix transcriptional regulator [Metallosphaera tengchongensis]
MSNRPLVLELESFFSALSDETRLEIVLYLMSRDGATVQEISSSLNKSQSLVSHHLSCLRNCGVVTVERRGKFSVYALNGGGVNKILNEAIEHVSKHSKSILSCEIVREEVQEREGKSKPTLSNHP